MAENAGGAANWDKLNIKMLMEKMATLCVLVSSRDKIIGQCIITREKLVTGFHVVSSALV